MRRKNTTSKMMKGYIIGALLLLMKKRDFSEISIGCLLYTSPSPRDA